MPHLRKARAALIAGLLCAAGGCGRSTPLTADSGAAGASQTSSSGAAGASGNGAAGASSGGAAGASGGASATEGADSSVDAATDAQACFPLFHDCTTTAECCAPNRCLTNGYKPQCQDEGPMMQPDKVTFRLILPAGQSFCAHCDGGFRITILDAAGATVTTNGWGPCLPDCSTCVAAPCPSIPCFPFPLPTNNDFVWDGTLSTTSTCGANRTCQEQVHARDGQYVAHMCATPGTFAMSDASLVGTCTETGPQTCVDVPFVYPTLDAVIGVLP